MVIMPFSNRWRFAIAAIAGGILPFAYAPYGYSFLAFISPLLWLYVLCGAGVWLGIGLGYVYGLFMFMFGIYWVSISIHLFGGLPLFPAYGVGGLFAAGLALYFALIGGVACWLSPAQDGRGNSAYFMLTCPAIWTLVEWFRGWFLTGFPWLNLGVSQTDTELAGYIPILGVYGVSFIVVGIAGSLLALWMPRRRWGGSVIVLVAVIVGAVYLSRVSWTESVGMPLKVAAVQSGQHQPFSRQEVKRSLQLYQTLTGSYQEYDVIIWPETAIHTIFDADSVFLKVLSDKATQADVVLLSGIFSSQEQSNYNSIVLIDGQEFRLYNKRQLVPFGEYIPFGNVLLPLLTWLTAPISVLHPDREGQSWFSTRHGVVGLSICYEDAFGREIRRALPQAELLVNVSNDSWFGDSIAPHQHLQIARVRALETGRVLIRGTNTGITAVIAPDGNIIGRTDLFQPAKLTHEVLRYQGQTPFVRWGYWPIILFSALIILFAGGRRLGLKQR